MKRSVDASREYQQYQILRKIRENPPASRRFIAWALQNLGAPKFCSTWEHHSITAWSKCTNRGTTLPDSGKNFP
jgi:hypothetical protein